MLKLSILSWNVQGINKNRKGIDIALLQETHIMTLDIGKLDNSKYDVVSSSHATNRTKGMMILMRKTFNFNIAEQGNDSAGRISYIKDTLADKKMAFISACCDMNAVLDPSMDRSGGQALCFVKVNTLQ
uniref:Endonuclease/exonuclease/phosphatase domain-containing protein n=1 Tax=Sparus aurata TaxID=8175 RepID=A0A671TPG6_SPAAU